ncbi:cupin domain-containing protein [Actinomadura sp. NPDC047616]|uniref:JmjC domain-containing protein n=1 Tax=Actinomadura sp. NPDC047616 TaxID=3155914 RepID=UPI00340024C5
MEHENVEDGPLARLTGRAADFRRSWPGRPAVHRSDAAWARSLLSFDAVDAVDALVAERALAPSRVAMSAGGFVDARSYTLAGAIDPVGLGDRLREGSTLLIQGLDEEHAPLIAFCRALTAEIGHPVQANAYLTPPRSRGFAHHWDGHSGFLIQTEGAKTWQIFEPAVPDPMTPGSVRTGELPADFGARTPFLEVELRAGDVLWLPRGWIHNGVTAGEWSLHVTVGVRQFTPHWLLGPLLRAASEEPALREALPPRVALDDLALRAAVARSRGALVEWLKAQSDERLAELVAPVLHGTLGGPARRPVRTAMAAMRGGADGGRPEAVELVPHAVLSVRESGDRVVLRLGDADVELDRVAFGEVELARKGDGRMTLRHLAGRIGPRAAGEVFDRLLRYGVAVPADPPSE